MEGKDTRIDFREDEESQITFDDLIRYLSEDNPPLDNESERVYENVNNYTINISTSEEDVDETLEKEEVEKEEISLSEMIWKSNEVAEFYSGQIEFGPIKGLPGAQQMQLEHKQRSILKNKYWERLLKNVYEIGTAKIPRPEHLNKILALFIINQEKLKKKREEENEVKHTERNKREKNIFVCKNTRMLIKSPKSAYRRVTSSNLVKRKSLLALLSSKDIIARTYAASTEIKKRIEKLDKVYKFKAEDLAVQSKNVLIRMPPYKKEDIETIPPIENDTTFFRMLNKCIFSQGFIEKWKSS